MPSCPKYCESVRNTVETCLAAGVKPKEIASELRVSNQWVYKLRERFDAFGTVSSPHPSVQGRPRKIHQAAREGIVELLEQNNTIYRDEVVDFLAEEYSITVSKSTVSRLLKQLQITRQKLCTCGNAPVFGRI